MAQSRPTVVIPEKTYVDIYAVTGIAVGTPLEIQNTGGHLLCLYESASEPTSVVGFNKLPKHEYMTNDDGNVGAWVRGQYGGLLQVEVA